MTKRSITSATLVAALALSGLAGATAAQDEVVEDEPSASITGELSFIDGVWSLTPVDGEPIELSFGPSWFTDLEALFGVSEGEVTVAGNVRDGMPNENASDVAKEKAAKPAVVKVRTVNDQKRAKGKPPWAGGPKVVGEAHPGHQGWSKGQADKPAKPGKPEAPAKPDKGGPQDR